MMTTITQIECASRRPVISRALLANDGAATLAASDALGVRLTDETERAQSIERILMTRPAGDLWIFAYGSLIWNPALVYAEQRIARIDGWHRAFCLSMPIGRGTPEGPGLCLGLDYGGSCTGIAYRIADDDLATELPILWRREMLITGYIPHWIPLVGQDGVIFGHAIAFVIDPGSPNYAGTLSAGAKVMRLATAEGSWGTSADYLFRTCDALRARGIKDPRLDQLADQVATALADASPMLEAA